MIERSYSIATAMVPVMPGAVGQAAIDAACAIARRVVLVGLVEVPEGRALSSGTAAARELRRDLRERTVGGCVLAKPRVRVSYHPWTDLCEVLAADAPDLLVLEWGAHCAALGVSPSEILAHPPCDVVLARGPFPAGALSVLMPVRGGPHAELVVRVGLSLDTHRLATLHLSGAEAPAGDAPFHGLEHVLEQLPEVERRTAESADPAATILEQARDFNLLIMGASAQPIQSSPALGPVAHAVLSESPAAVMVVKTRRSMPLAAPGPIAGAQAISVLVDKWFAENTFQGDEFGDLDRLVALKRERGVTISLALPALNEEETVGNVIRTLKAALMDAVPLLDEIVLIDSSSSDRTREIAAQLGVPVFIHQELLPEIGARRGKGEALWKSLLATCGDIVAWVDTDIVNIHPRFVYGILGPLLASPRIQFVKGFYRRPLRVGDKIQAGGGGRVTELTARPLINLFYPELSGVVQPLSGEYAGRRAVLERVPFFSGYGVETGLLIDVFEQCGLSAIAQVDLLERIHHNQPLEALSKMSFAILQAVVRKLERRYGRAMLDDVNKSMKLIRHEAGEYFLDVEELVEQERPPMITVPAYAAARATLGIAEPARAAA